MGILSWYLWLLMIGVCHGALVDLRRYRRIIVLLHNTYRAHERAAGMKALRWDPYLELRAAEWSEQCYWGHQGNGLGENLATFWTTGPQMSVSDIILKSHQNWWNEVRDWSWSTSCGNACHYTQMIWANTERIGCSLSKCPSMINGGGEGNGMRNADYFVCFYDPPGNVVGQYPYRPGRSCSGCNPRDSCANRLCYSPARRYGRRITPRTSRRKTYRRSFFAYKPRQTVQPRHTSGLGRERYSYSDAEPGEGASEAAAEAREL